MTKHQITMLAEAAASPDGSVIARGWSVGKHAPAVGKSLVRLGYLRVDREAMGGGTVYRITDAGRLVVVARDAVAS